MMLLAIGPGAMLPSPALAQVVADPYQSSVAMLKRATRAQRDGSHLPLLFALRQLRDADLKGLFLQLAQQDGKSAESPTAPAADSGGSWPMQVHAVLGLAEIAPEKHIDPWLITQIASEAQEAVIASSLDGGLLPESLIGEILQWDQLNAMARLFLLAEQQTHKQPIDVGELSRLSKSDNSHIAALASGLLAQSGDPAAPATLAAFQAALAGKPDHERLAVTMWLMDGARRYELTALADWIASAIAAPDADPDVVYRGTLALLSLDPARGLPAWERYLGPQPSFPHRVRCGTILLTARGKPPASAYDKLLPAGEDEQLIARIADAGKAIASEGDPTDALIALLDVGHAKTSLWAIEYLKEMPAERSRRAYVYLIDRMHDPQQRWTEGIAQAVEAATRLFEIEPEEVLKRLRDSEDDSALQQALLLGLFETSSSKAGDAAAALPRIGSGRADSLALLLQAKHRDTLAPEQLKQLGTIACGGGRVSEILQVQAAWLYLRHSGKADQAMTVVFAKNE